MIPALIVNAVNAPASISQFCRRSIGATMGEIPRAVTRAGRKPALLRHRRRDTKADAAILPPAARRLRGRPLHPRRRRQADPPRLLARPQRPLAGDAEAEPI